MTNGRRLGIVMDPIQHIKPYKDTSLAFLLEAQRRDWAIHYFEMQDLYLRDGQAKGQGRPLTVTDDRGDWFSLGDADDIALGDLDVILMRKDPPFDLEYVYATQLLELAERAGALVVNRAAAIRDNNEKLAIQRFPQCCAPTLVSRHPARIREFLAEQQHIVVKPLDGMGGYQVFVLQLGDPNTTMILDSITLSGTRQVMAQRYIPEISAGDKRILVIDGIAYPRALARVPLAGETRGNLAAGGTGKGVELTQRDHWIVEQVAAYLREEGLLFVGLDVIGDYLTEINVTSPTCVRELDAIYNDNISARLFEAIEARL